MKRMVLAAFATTVILASDAQSQPVIELMEQQCTRCSVVLDTLAILPRKGSLPLSDQARFAFSPKGTVFITDEVAWPGTLIEVDTNGKQLRQTPINSIGQPGKPMFNPAGMLVIPNERTGVLYTVEDGVTVKTPASAIDNQQGGYIMGDGNLVVNATSSQLKYQRYAIHITSLGSASVRSVDHYDGRVLTARERYLMLRRISAHDLSTFWAGHINKYEIDLWNTAGQRQLTFTRSVPWFPPLTKNLTAARLRPPPASLRDIYDNEKGLLFVTVSVADPQWRGYELPLDPDGMGGIYVGRNQHLRNDAIDTIIEVVDVNSRSVLASLRLDAELSYFIGQGAAVVYAGSSNENGSYFLVRPRLSRLQP